MYSANMAYSGTYKQSPDSYLQPSKGPMFNGQKFKMYGFVLSVIAAATFALGVANVVLTSEAYCDTWEEMDPVYCSGSGEPYIWTWISSGIWASAPIFIAGLFAITLHTDPSRWTKFFKVFIFMSGIIFAPAMIILSAIEVWRGHASKWHFYKLGGSLAEGNIMVEDSPYQAKFALPLVITILGGIMFLMTGLITLALCFCMDSFGINTKQEQEPADSMIKPIYTPTPTMSQASGDVYCPPRHKPDPDARSPGDYQPTTGPFMATRYNSVHDHSPAGSTFGNFSSRGFNPAPASIHSGGSGGSTVGRC